MAAAIDPKDYPHLIWYMQFAYQSAIPTIPKAVQPATSESDFAAHILAEIDAILSLDESKDEEITAFVKQYSAYCYPAGGRLTLTFMKNSWTKNQTAYPRLRQMFGAFFHQDWDMEGKDWPDLVHNFATGQPISELQAAAKEIEDLLANMSEDAALQHFVGSELGCEYLPRPDLGGPTFRGWLGLVADLLRKGG